MEEFWAALNITSSAIPNEMLLRLYDYHGLRHAIYKQGGCACVVGRVHYIKNMRVNLKWGFNIYMSASQMVSVSLIGGVDDPSNSTT